MVDTACGLICIENEEKTNEQIAQDTIESLFDNGGKILGLTPFTNSASVGFNHFLNEQVADIFGAT